MQALLEEVVEQHPAGAGREAPTLPLGQEHDADLHLSTRVEGAGAHVADDAQVTERVTNLHHQLKRLRLHPRRAVDLIMSELDDLLHGRRSPSLIPRDRWEVAATMHRLRVVRAHPAQAQVAVGELEAIHA